MSMTDPNYKDFSGRLRRIEKAQAKGYGFEAKGTLGKSGSAKGRPGRGRLPSVLGGILITLTVAVLLKGALFFMIGETVYNQRVAALEAGSDFDHIAAKIMAPDMLTRAISQGLSQVFPPHQP